MLNLFGTKKEETASSALSKTLIHMMQERSLAFYAELVVRLKMSFKKCGTAYTDYKSITYDEDFFMKLNKDERLFVVLHELLHVALLHNLRRGNRDSKKWNIAADYAINGLIYNDLGITIPKGALHDKKYNGLSVEEIYTQLEDDPDSDSFLGSEDLQGLGSNSPETESAIREAQTAIGEMMEEALQSLKMQGKEAGKLPAGIELFIKELEKPILPWNIILSRYLHAKVKGGTNWKRRNRRHPEVYLPSRKKEGLERIDFVIDTSGSISSEEFVQFLSEIDQVLKQFKPKSIGVSQFDTVHYGTEIVNKTTDIKAIKFKGGGGTDIEDTFDKIKEYPTKCFLILTDGYLDIPTNHPEQDIIWLVYDNPDFTSSYGKVIHWKRS